MFRYKQERSASVAATVDQVFEYIDDPARLTSHMSESSWRMGGDAMRMVTERSPQR